MAPAEIPKNLHFVWFGRELPCFAAIALRSAQQKNPDARVHLWHEDSLTQDVRVLGLADRGIQLCRLDVPVLIRAARVRTERADVKSALGVLERVWGSLSAPAARSNVVRLLLLFTRGGIYLDTDTLTLRSFDDLCVGGAFCGLENILWSKTRRNRRSAYYWTLGPLLSGFRYVNARTPSGYRTHRALLGGFEQAANNAVLGFEAGHPFLERAFLRIGQLDPEQWPRRFRLGTHLLQELLENAAPPEPTVERYPPSYFYPLGPIVSAHYFRQRTDAARTARELISPETHLIHWYASVADLLPLDEAYIERERERSVFAHLCADFLR